MRDSRPPVLTAATSMNISVTLAHTLSGKATCHTASLEGGGRPLTLCPVRAASFLGVTWPCGGPSLAARRVKRLPARRETQVRSLGQEDTPEKEMATHHHTLAWRIPWTGGWWAEVRGVAKSRTGLSDLTFTGHVTSSSGPHNPW